jgi:hypothetical protein
MITRPATRRSFAARSGETGTNGGFGSVTGVLTLPVIGLSGWYRSAPHAQPAGV